MPIGDKAPRLSVGLAVYNGERYLGEAIESILSQTFTDFELIISDNASTDGTPEICEQYQRSDARVRYSRNERNIGGANNENLTFRYARGEYFRWAAHDDICEPTLFESCADLLDEQGDVVLCYTRTVIIDAEGLVLGDVYERRGMASRPSDRFHELAPRRHLCEATYGIIRSSALRSTGLQRNYTDSDRVLLAALALRGRFVQLDEPLFRKRMHEKNVYSDWRARMNWFDPDSTRRVRMPNWMEAGHLALESVRAPISFRERARCLGWAAHWIGQEWRELAVDLKYSARALVRRPTDAWRYDWE